MKHTICANCKLNSNDVVVFTKRTIFDTSSCDKANPYCILSLNLRVCKTMKLTTICLLLYL